MGRHVRVAAAALAVFFWAALLFNLAVGIAFAAADGITLIDIAGRTLSSFTILANAGAAIVLTAIARDAGYLRRAEWIVAFAVYLLIVTLTYLAEFGGALETTGIRMLPDAAIHIVMPVLYVVFWFAFVPKGALGWRTPFVILLFPLAYLAYMLARGTLTGTYAYPFLDAGALGYFRVARNSLGLLGAYLVVGAVFTLIDCGLSRFSGPIDAPSSRA